MEKCAANNTVAKNTGGLGLAPRCQSPLDDRLGIGGVAFRKFSYFSARFSRRALLLRRSWCTCGGGGGGKGARSVRLSTVSLYLTRFYFAAMH